MEIEVIDNEQRGKIYMLEGDKCYEKNILTVLNCAFILLIINI